MAQKFLTDSIEAATITLTNGGTNSDSNLLKDRDNGTLGLVVASGSTTIDIEVEFSSSKTIDYFVLSNLSCSNNTEINFYYWTGAVYTSVGQITDDTYDGAIQYKSTTSQASAKWKIELVRSVAGTVDLSSIFMGVEYATPHNYQHMYDNGSRMINQTQRDQRQYPYSFNIDTSKKLNWGLFYHLTAAQKTALESELATALYDGKPFIFYDGIRDTNYHLVSMIGSELVGTPLMYDLFDIPLALIEL